LATFLGFRKLLYSCTEGMCHSSTFPGMSLYMTQFYQAFPRISTASDKRWGEKAWVRGYGTWLLTVESWCRRFLAYSWVSSAEDKARHSATTFTPGMGREEGV